jgi:hypothetical protein
MTENVPLGNVRSSHTGSIFVLLMASKRMYEAGLEAYGDWGRSLA